MGGGDDDDFEAKKQVWATQSTGGVFEYEFKYLKDDDSKILVKREGYTQPINNYLGFGNEVIGTRLINGRDRFEFKKPSLYTTPIKKKRAKLFWETIQRGWSPPRETRKRMYDPTDPPPQVVALEEDE